MIAPIQIGEESPNTIPTYVGITIAANGRHDRESVTETIPPFDNMLKSKGEKSEVRAHSVCWQQHIAKNSYLVQLRFKSEARSRQQCRDKTDDHHSDSNRSTEFGLRCIRDNKSRFVSGFIIRCALFLHSFQKRFPCSLSSASFTILSASRFCSRGTCINVSVPKSTRKFQIFIKSGNRRSCSILYSPFS